MIIQAEEYKEYLAKTVERPELEEAKRLDYIDFQITATEPRVSERTLAYVDEEVDERMTFPLKYSPVMKEIDRKIQEIAEKQFDVPQIEKDVVERIQEQKLIERDNGSKENDQNKSG